MVLEYPKWFGAAFDTFCEVYDVRDDDERRELSDGFRNDRRWACWYVGQVRFYVADCGYDPRSHHFATWESEHPEHVQRWTEKWDAYVGKQASAGVAGW